MPSAPRPPRALLLDFGGTLAAEVASRGELYALEGRTAGLEVDGEVMGRHMRAVHDALPQRIDGAFRYTRTWFERFIREVFVGRLGLAESRLAGVTEALFARFASPRTFALRPGARGIVETARELGVRTAIVSNWSEALVGLVDGLGLRPDVVVSSADVGLEKPDPRIFELALARLGAPPEAAWHAGDSVRNDVEGARGAGVTGILVGTGGPRSDAESGTGPAVASLDELSSRLAAAARGGAGT